MSRTVLLIWDNGEPYADHRIYFVRCESVAEAKNLRLLAERLDCIEEGSRLSGRPRGHALGIVEIEEWLGPAGELRTIAWFLQSGPLPKGHDVACSWPSKVCGCGQAVAETWISMSLRREPVDGVEVQRG